MSGKMASRGWRRCLRWYSRLGTIFLWCIVSTVGSCVHCGTAQPDASRAHAAGDREAFSVHKDGRDINKSDHCACAGNAASSVAIVADRHFAAKQVLQRGMELHNRGEIDGSIVQYHRAIDLNRDLSSAWLNLGIALSAMGRDDEAMGAYKVVFELPTALPLEVATAYCNLGYLAQVHAGVDFYLLEEAVLLFQSGLKILPDNSGCLYNFGGVMEKLGRYPEARDLYIRALRLNSSLGNAHLNLGNIAFRSGNWTEGILRYERAYASPDADQRLLTVSTFLLGHLHRHGKGDLRAAVEYYRRSFEIDNTYTDSLCAILQSLRSLCLWEGWESLEPRVASVIVDGVSSGKEPGPQSPYETRFTGELKASQHLGLARLASRQYDRIEHLSLPQDTNILSFRRRGRHQQQQQGIRRGHFVGVGGTDIIDKTGNGKNAHPRRDGAEEVSATPAAGVIVVYGSYDYRDHAMGHLTRGIFCNHQAQNRVFAVAASYGPDDAGSVRRSAETCFTKFLDLLTIGRVESATLVAAERPQIFVDLMAHTFGARPGIVALKPAPIVATYLAYPGTTGAEYTDYSIVDKVVVPPELANIGFSEKMVFLPHSYQANNYNVSHGFCPGGEGLRDCHASVRNSRGLAGFLESWGTEGRVLCNYNTIHKMEPESFGVFMNIMKRVAGSVLLLLDSSPDNGDDVELNIRAEAASRGIHPDRIWFDEKLSREDHILRASGSCDLFVDSFVYGAHTTAADALWAGLPFLTLRGYGVDDTPVGQMSGRVGTSLVSALGMPELSFHSVKELEDAAVVLVKSPGRLASLRTRLLSLAMSTPVFDTPLITRNLERAFEAMWETRELGLPPRHIVVDPTQGPLPRLQLAPDDHQTVDGAYPFRVTSGDEQYAIEDDHQVVATISDMGARALEDALAWEETKTEDDAEAALVATGRVLAGIPLSVEALHLRGVALFLLGRNAEAAVVMERAALLATSMKHKQPGLDLARLWGNLAAAQQAAAEENGLPFAPAATTGPFLKALALSPSQPSPLHNLLKSHLRRGDHTACVESFWQHWAGIRGFRPPTSRRKAAEGVEEVRKNGPREMEGASPDDYGDGWAWGVWRGGNALSMAGVLEVAATCFVRLGRLEEAWRAWKLAAEIQPDNQEFPLWYTANLERAGHQNKAQQEFSRVIKALNHVWFSAEGGLAVPKIPRPAAEVDGQTPPTVIAVYCFEYGNAWFPNWSPSDLALGRGLGGSEEMVIQLSRELANLGFWVEVYAEPKENDVGRDRGYGRGGGGVVWYPFKAYDVSRPPDVFIAWRYHVSLHLAGSSGLRLLWLHDVPAPFFQGIVDIVDGIICPSLYHASLIEPESVRSLVRVVPNGIDPRRFQDGINSPDVFVYGSAPNRGLRAVLLMWPYIRSQIRTATLEVYYGFSANFLKWGGDNIVGFDDWINDMKRLLNQEGVFYKGMVDHDTLHSAYARAGFILYPSAFPETGCISLIKAMAMGAIPVTSRFSSSTLQELTSDWDMGPRQALASHHKTPEQDMAWLETWAKAVVHASKTEQSERDNTQRHVAVDGSDGDASLDGKNPEGGIRHEGIQARRRAMKAAVRKRYAFSATAMRWAEEIAGEPGERLVHRERSDRKSS